ncbi:MAG: hypothetical protein M3137_12550 [Actinomycetota bacterium]|nr:hypothetical protein [Actinomycetota bacterium]
MIGGSELDPRYVAARGVLLDALTSLAPHGKAVIVVGAQAVYLRTGGGDVAITIAPYTTDGDLAIDPTLLDDEPGLEESMAHAGFQLDSPGIWHAVRRVGDDDVVIPVDLIVPEGASTGQGRRGARLGPHGNRAARRAIGLEGALVDHSTMTISALNTADERTITVEVAGSAALIVAKAPKISDRVNTGKVDRLSDKDAADVYRIMQSTRAPDVAATLRELLDQPLSSAVTAQALEHVRKLFGRRTGQGVRMAQQALRLAVDEEEVSTLAVAYTDQLLEAAR